MAHLKDITKIKPGGRWTLEQNRTLVLRRCSPEEERNGCSNFTSPRFSVQTVNDTVFIALHNVTESDAGRYTFQVAGDNEEQFNVTVEKPPGSTEKSTGSTETESPNTSSINIPLAICLPILAVLLLLLLYFMCKQKITIWLERLREPHRRHVCPVFRV
ncbi:hypothetical protein IRJ41_015357 [Triplophysa rosa]|uniref:Immunoglobulin V-set domain-containing protein n=1 Tax=Triplophysa rosa TaxID=992332 RepID=A0A9W7TDK7_TRIRA|nr:hypothetical protein IRJ41_015357 [Triplophysa rosa]